jgi:uncharacterized protein YecT (DUF1311 family)
MRTPKTGQTALLAAVGALVAVPLMAVPLVSGAPRDASATTPAAGAAAPVITEPFRPVLPCNPNTTVGSEGCGEHHVLVADSQLNADVKLIFRLISSSVSRRDFTSAEADWLTYRDQDCKSQSDAYLGGTEQPVLYVDCLASDDASRRQDLQGFFKLLTQGLGSQAPKFP